MSIHEPHQRRMPMALNREILGMCSYCGKPSGAAFGVWHPECWAEYRRLRELNQLAAEVADRDGLACAWCGKPGWIGPREKGARMSLRLELDHRVPLWAVADFPPAIRRAFHTPANLQLLCPADHKRKTAGEAAARAEVRRRADVEPNPPQPIDGAQ